jgi:hypothetical protein
MRIFRKRTFDVFTHHKCASRWLLAYFQAFARANGLRLGWTHSSDIFPDKNDPYGDVRLFLNAGYDFSARQNLRGLHIVRCPLSILASAYHSHLRTHTVEDWPELVPQREILQNCTTDEGYLLTIAFLGRPDFGWRAIGPFLALGTWDFEDNRFTTARMEDVVQDISGTLGLELQRHFGKDIRLPSDQDFSFSCFSGERPPGAVDENSHYRSGDPFQWRHELPQVAVTYLATQFRDFMREYYKEHLIDPLPLTSRSTSRRASTER